MVYTKQITYIHSSTTSAILYKLLLFLLPIYGYGEPYASVQESDTSLHIATRSPLHLAVQEGQVAVVKALLKQPDILVNAKDKYNGTPFISQHIKAM